MSETMSSFSEVRPMELNFPEDKSLENKIAGGSFYYIREFGLAIFLLHEEAGFTLCLGRGDFRSGNSVRSFDRLQSYQDQENAEAALKKVEYLTLEYFRSVSDEVDRESQTPSTNGEDL